MWKGRAAHTLNSLILLQRGPPGSLEIQLTIGIVIPSEVKIVFCNIKHMI